MRLFIAHFLFVLAGWTLIIKFIFPMSFALATGAPIQMFIYWDFWWVAHIWLGVALITRPVYTFYLAVTVTVAEVAIIVPKLYLFLGAPDWTIWQTNWFINKLFVLACFVMLAGLLISRGSSLESSTRATSSA